MAKTGIFPRGEGLVPKLLAATTTHTILLFALLLVGVTVWVTCLLLLWLTTRQLLDTLNYIVEIAHLS